MINQLFKTRAWQETHKRMLKVISVKLNEQGKVVGVQVDYKADINPVSISYSKV
ncbi:hypothetical protein ACI3ER_11345 [Bacillus sp. Wb]